MWHEWLAAGVRRAAVATKLHYFNTDFDLEDICWSPAASTGALSNRTPWLWRRTFQTEYYTHPPKLKEIIGIMIFNLHKATITACDQVTSYSSSWPTREFWGHNLPRESPTVQRCSVHITLRGIPLHCRPTPRIFTFLARDQFSAPSPVNHEQGRGRGDTGTMTATELLHF